MKIIEKEIYEVVLAKLATRMNKIDGFEKISFQLVQDWYQLNELSFMELYTSDKRVATLHLDLVYNDKARPINVYEFLRYLEIICENIKNITVKGITRFSVPDSCDRSFIFLEDLITELKTEIVHSLPMYLEVKL